MKFPVTLDIYSPTKAGEGDPIKTVTVNSEVEFDSIKNIHFQQKHIIKVREVTSGLDVKGNSLMILKFLSRRDDSTHEKYIKREFLGTSITEMESARVFLIKEGYITFQDSIFSLTQKGRDYIHFYDNYESAEMFNGNVSYALIKFLYEMNHPVHLDYFPTIIKINAPDLTSGSKDLDFVHWLEIDKDMSKYIERKGSHTYQLNDVGRSYFTHLQNKRKIDSMSANVNASSTENPQTTLKDGFSPEEIINAESKLDLILKDLETLKMGHEVIYEDLTDQVNELREYFFLGKRKWNHLLLGKVLEMTAGGVVAETTAKPIVHEIMTQWSKITQLQL